MHSPILGAKPASHQSIPQISPYLHLFILKMDNVTPIHYTRQIHHVREQEFISVIYRRDGIGCVTHFATPGENKKIVCRSRKPLTFLPMDTLTIGVLGLHSLPHSLTNK